MIRRARLGILPRTAHSARGVMVQLIPPTLRFLPNDCRMSGLDPYRVSNSRIWVGWSRFVQGFLVGSPSAGGEFEKFDLPVAALDLDLEHDTHVGCVVLVLDHIRLQWVPLTDDDNVIEHSG